MVETINLVVPETFEHLPKVWEFIWIDKIIQVSIIPHKIKTIQNYNWKDNNEIVKNTIEEFIGF